MKKYIIFSLLAEIILAGCSKKAENPVIQDSGNKEIKLERVVSFPISDSFAVSYQIFNEETCLAHFNVLNESGKTLFDFDAYAWGTQERINKKTIPEGFIMFQDAYARNNSPTHVYVVEADKGKAYLVKTETVDVAVNHERQLLLRCLDMPLRVELIDYVTGNVIKEFESDNKYYDPLSPISIDKQDDGFLVRYSTDSMDFVDVKIPFAADVPCEIIDSYITALDDTPEEPVVVPVPFIGPKPKPADYGNGF